MTADIQPRLFQTTESIFERFLELAELLETSNDREINSSPPGRNFRISSTISKTESDSSTNIVRTITLITTMRKLN